jgi:hypothetical protein
MHTINPGIMASLAGRRPAVYLYDIIAELGLTTSLSAVWDVADPACYSGTGDDWLDRVDPANNVWVRGNGVAANKPTFTGTAGVPTESTYWLLDGADYFSGSAGLTFADQWHKNNARCSFIYGMYVIADTNDQLCFTSDAFGGAPDTLTFYVADTEHAGMRFNDGTFYESTTACTINSWNIWGASYSEPSTIINWNVNGNASSDTTSAKTSTFVPVNPPQLMTNDSGFAFVCQNGTRLAFVAMWDTDIGVTALQSLYTALKARRLPSAP